LGLALKPINPHVSVLGRLRLDRGMIPFAEEGTGLDALLLGRVKEH